MPIHFGTDGWRANSDTFTFHNLRMVRSSRML
jgi:hypothetical protein